MAAAETIAALASGAGRAGVAVIRLSGPAALPAIAALTGRPAPKPRQAALRRLINPASREHLDHALVLAFAGPSSFTGEDVAEFHIHGGQAVIAAVLGALLKVPGVRLAGPGEFTRRAFENGKLDLTEAEGLADLVDAETEGQRRQALRQLEGALGAAATQWRARLIAAMALIEAQIDFPDEDIPGGLTALAGPEIQALEAEIRASLAAAARGVRVREGYRIAILGAPNAGKSSLLNALAGREAAIVSDIPGTTRDVIEVRLTLAGFPVWIADTAGLRDAADAIEAEGVKRALARAEEADLRLIVIDAALAPDAAVTAQARAGDLVLWNKADLAGAAAAGPNALPISAKTGEGLEALVSALEARISEHLGATEAPALTRARHRMCLEAAAESLSAAHANLAGPAELAGEELRRAADALGRLTGRIDVEDVLGEIFARFCIGK